jgi:DNA-directed RNA polymerase subunit H (RpoH/RPB5)
MTEINISSTHFKSIYNARKNIIDVLSSLNYNVDDVNHFSVDELNAMIQHNSLDFSVSQNVTETDRVENDNDNENENKEEVTGGNGVNALKPINTVYVRFYELFNRQNKRPSKLTTSNIDDMIDDVYFINEYLKPHDRLLIISHDDPHDTLLSHMKMLWETKHILVSNISMKRLQFNILNHSFVPKHTILSKTKYNEFRHKYNIVSDRNIPEISRFDAVASLIGMKPGQICEILRPSKTAIQAPYYRVCVNH